MSQYSLPFYVLVISPDLFQKVSVQEFELVYE